jgi:hypothetical protein
MIALVPLVTSERNAPASKELSTKTRPDRRRHRPTTNTGGSGMTALIRFAAQASRNAMEWNHASPNDQ